MSPTAHFIHIVPVISLALFTATLILPQRHHGIGTYLRKEDQTGHRATENILAMQVSISAISVLFPLSLACQEYHWRCSETLVITQWRIRRPGHLTMCLFPMIFCLNSFPSSQKHESGAMTDTKPSVNCLAELCLATQLYHSTTHKRPESTDKNNDIKTNLEMPSFKENLQKSYHKTECLRQFYIQSVSTNETLTDILTHNQPNTMSAYAFFAR